MKHSKTAEKLNIIAIHGNGGGGFRFQLAESHFDGGIEFNALTLPGFANDPVTHTTMAEFAQFVSESISSTDGPRVLMGHGIGGSIALEVLREHRDQIDGIILHSPVGAKLDRRAFPKIVKAFGVSTAAKFLISNPLLSEFWSSLFFASVPDSNYKRKFFKNYSQCNAFGLMFELITADWFNSLTPASDLPACILWGEKEKLLTSDQIEPFKKLLPMAKVEVIQDWKHFPMIDSPKDYAEVLSRVAYDLVATNRAVTAKEV